LFGVATSLGLGAQQLNAGLTLLAELPSASLGVQLALIAIMTAVATTSVVIGLQGGIRRLSMFNIGLGAVILAFVLFAGPTTDLPRVFTSALGAYLTELPERSFHVRPPGASAWQEDWTLFYWSWWISWAPFVGVFVARISRGRTLREFVVTVLFVPTLVTFVWLTVLGGTGIEQLGASGGGALAEAARSAPATALHQLLSKLPLASLTMLLATLLIVVFFISSSDSGSLVDDMVTSGGDPNPPRAQRVFWAVSEGAVAATLLAAGGLEALRTASLQSGVPMLMVLLAAAVGLVRALRRHESSAGRGPPQRVRT
jgi:choline/glycine/proline betaine transport protein